MWRDCLHLVQTMPSHVEVLDAFLHDLESDDKWPLMTEMTRTYGIGLWIENSSLLFIALKNTKLEFFKRFKSIIARIIRYTSTMWSSKDNKDLSLIRCAIKCEEIQILQIILDCWIENINQDIEDPLTQRLYHASYLINSEDIFQLARYQPTLFIKFISKIKLVKTSDIMLKKTVWSIYNPSKYKVISSKFTNKRGMWKDYMETYESKQNKSIKNKLWNLSNNKYISQNQQISSKYLPLMKAASREMLNAFVDISKKERSVEVNKLFHLGMNLSLNINRSLKVMLENMF